MISTDLLIKGLGSAVAFGSGGGLFVCHRLGYFFNQELIKLGEKIGLDCRGAPTDRIGVQCFKKEGGEGIKVKQGEKEFDLSDIPKGSGVIKAYLESGGEEKKFKFLIEDGDIAVGEEGSNKLEEFETYEIEEEGGTWKLVRKSDAKSRIKSALGMGEIGCDIPKDDGCTLDLEKLKKINFEGKDEGIMSVAENTKLKITAEDNREEYPLGYKFVLESSGETKISGEITLKNGMDTEFRIKKKGRGLGTSLSLERKWTVKTLGEKAGLKCPENKRTGVCSLVDGSINVKNGEENKFENLSRKEGENRKVRFSVEEGGHNQGFKFYTEEEIVLVDGEKNVKDNQKIEPKGDGGTVSYEIKKDTDKWYLTKKGT